MSTDTNRDDEFSERIAEPLRSAERADASFEARVMSAVQADARTREAERGIRPWLTRPYSMQLTPLTTLALAAGFSAFVFLGATGVRRATGSTLAAGATTPSGRVDTVHLVRFVFADGAASHVALVGGFNQWDKTATPLRPGSADGVWTVSVPLEGGLHEYAFIVTDEKGQRWVADPWSQPVKDEHGVESSVIRVSAEGS